MLFKCLPPGAPIPGRFPGPVHARGKWFTVDIHCHVLTPKAAEMVAESAAATRHPREVYANERTREVNRQQAERNRIQSTSVEKRLEDMDRMGIDIQAISPSPNQTYYAADPDLAVTELDRIHKALGFRGIEIATNVAGEDLSAERFRKIFARVEELGLLVVMHPTGFPEARRFADHYLVNVIGNPLDTTVAVHHLIFGGVLRDHPNLKLVLAHGGGYLPAYSGRIDHAASARPDTCERIDRMPTTYLKRLYFDTIVYSHHQLEYLVDQYGADHVLVGTDYPADMGEVDPIGFIEGASGLDDNERRAILGRNAARLLNIEIPSLPG